jgi:hypothetical protein
VEIASDRGVKYSTDVLAQLHNTHVHLSSSQFRTHLQSRPAMTHKDLEGKELPEGFHGTTIVQVEAAQHTADAEGLHERFG